MAAQVKNKFLEIVCGVDGEVSSKRIVMLLCTFAILITWGANLWYDTTIEQFIFDGIMYIIAVGLGATTAEKFSKK